MGARIRSVSFKLKILSVYWKNQKKFIRRHQRFITKEGKDEEKNLSEGKDEDNNLSEEIY